MGIGKESGDPVDHEVSDTAMAAVLNLGAVFELIMGRLNERAPLQQALIKQGQEPVRHILAYGSN